MPENKAVEQDQIDIRLRALYGETLGRIDEKLKNLDYKLDSVSKDIGVGNVAVKTVMDDHEKRIRSLEQRMVLLFGIASVVGWVLSVLTPLVKVTVAH